MQVFKYQWEKSSLEDESALHWLDTMDKPKTLKITHKTIPQSMVVSSILNPLSFMVIATLNLPKTIPQYCWSGPFNPQLPHPITTA